MSTGAVVPGEVARALAAQALLAVDPQGLGGVVVSGSAGPARDEWLTGFRALLPAGAPTVRITPSVTDDRLAGGLDLAATLAAGRPVAEPGVLAQADGGALVVAMAERIGDAAVAQLMAALDNGEVRLERDGIGASFRARFALILLDESEPDEPAPPAALLERLAFRVEVSPIPAGMLADAGTTASEVTHARERLAGVIVGEDMLDALVRTAAAFGIGSLRAPILAARAARAAAALEGRPEVAEPDVRLAAELVLAPRATRIPAPPEEENAPAPPPPSDQAETEDDAPRADDPLADRLIEAARAVLPADLLAQLAAGPRAAVSGRARGTAKSASHGRRVGTRRGDPRRARLDVLDTLRAAAPWQAVRRSGGQAVRQTDGQADRRTDGRGAGTGKTGAAAPDYLTARPSDRLAIRPDDFRVRRYVQKIGTTVVFLVDASGSAALHRLAEAKGAVELLLADSYVRRDRVALVTFRGRAAELILPPTRSLVRAKRLLAGVPGGGGTPLASALDTGCLLGVSIRRGGGNPLLVVLSDGKANVARDGTGGRPQAETDALASARHLALSGVPGLFIDTSPRANPFAARVAEAARFRYLPLPSGDAQLVSGAVRACRGVA